MDVKKCIATAAALALLGGAMTINAVENPVIPSFFASAEESSSVVEIAHVGEKYTISLGNTTDTPTWTSANEKIATVKSTGGLNAEITGVSVGTTTVYANLPDQTLAITVKVLAEAVAGEEETIQLPDLTFGANQNTANIGISEGNASDFVWTSSDTSVAVVSPDGVITALSKGTCVITGKKDNTTYVINVTSNYDPAADSTDPVVVEQPQVIELNQEKPAQRVNIGELPEGITPQWSSTDISVAVVDLDGIVSAVGPGECKVQVQLGNTIYSFKVVSTFDPDKGYPQKEVGTIQLNNANPTRQINLSGIDDPSGISWSSSNESVAAVDENGLVTAKSSGNCVISAFYMGTLFLVNVESTYTGEAVELPVIEIPGVGTAVQLSGGESALSWSSADESIAVVDKSGKVTAKGIGETIVTAHFENSESSVRIVVKEKTVYGDANTDGNVDLNDAVAILQYVALAQKYPLSEQGMKNADCFNPGDGISGKDALAVQMVDAKVITALPLIEN